MSGTYLFEKVMKIKDEFKKSFIHKKKHRSLENYSSVVVLPEEQQAAISLLKHKLKTGFLSDRLSSFLDAFLEDHELNFLDWAYKTKWLKEKMRAMKQQEVYAKPVQMTMFDYPQMRQYTIPNVPLEILSQIKTVHHGARV